MSKLTFYIADNDTLYVESLSRYLRSVSRPRIEVGVFTSSEMLTASIGNNIRKPDAVLINPSLLTPELKDKFDNILVLSPDSSSYSVYNTIFKYQAGNMLLDDILSSISKISPEKIRNINSNNSTKVFSVISPEGGSGKSVIAFHTAARFTALGFKVLYLNLETNTTTGLFTNIPENHAGLSDILYYMKQNSSNIWARINNCICTDSTTGVCFLPPLYTPVEMDEVNGTDIEGLITELKNSNRFDVIIVDNDSAVNGRILSVVDMSDIILLITGSSLNSEYKTVLFETALKKIYAERTPVTDRIIHIVNKANQFRPIRKIQFNGTSPVYEIPFINDQPAPQSRTANNKTDDSFKPNIEYICEMLIQKAAPVSNGEIS
ncbi:MAG: hypothetical protein Q8920_14160 [Bacillota bacterium]|nr:hypothetical protein [Bacillota bacterium]